MTSKSPLVNGLQDQLEQIEEEQLLKAARGGATSAIPREMQAVGYRYVNRVRTSTLEQMKKLLGVAGLAATGLIGSLMLMSNLTTESPEEQKADRQMAKIEIPKMNKIIGSQLNNQITVADIEHHTYGGTGDRAFYITLQKTGAEKSTVICSISTEYGNKDKTNNHPLIIRNIGPETLIYGQSGLDSMSLKTQFNMSAKVLGVPATDLRKVISAIAQKPEAWAAPQPTAQKAMHPPRL